MREPAVPLCVDLDGSLAATDTLHESLLALARRSPAALLRLPGWLRAGKAAFKRQVAAHASIDVTNLPFRQDVLEWLRAQRDAGRRLVLATSADEQVATQVAAHLRLFDEVVASNGVDNLTSDGKRRALVARYGEKGFDYVGNDGRRDEAVWRSSRHAIVVGGESIVRRARAVTHVERVFPVGGGSLAVWVEALRLHQWAKNALVFLPPLLAHTMLQPRIFVDALAAFVAFGLCASSGYVVNDLLDLVSDRRHPRKQRRPFAAGVLSVRSGVACAAVGLAGAGILAATTRWSFVAVLAGYFAITTTYSLWLKRVPLVDVMTLAGLYTVRVLGGGAATDVLVSFWLLAFSVFMFLSLAMVKRYTELEDAVRRGSRAVGRGYQASDLPLLLALGTASGYCTVLVVALYINSPESEVLYRHTRPLWLICPLLLYWISRVWLLTTRGQMHDDPVIFALRDRVSLLVLGLLVAIVALAI